MIPMLPCWIDKSLELSWRCGRMNRPKLAWWSRENFNWTIPLPSASYIPLSHSRNEPRLMGWDGGVVISMRQRGSEGMNTFLLIRIFYARESRRQVSRRNDFKLDKFVLNPIDRKLAKSWWDFVVAICRFRCGRTTVWAKEMVRSFSEAGMRWSLRMYRQDSLFRKRQRLDVRSLESNLAILCWFSCVVSWSPSPSRFLSYVWVRNRTDESCRYDQTLYEDSDINRMNEAAGLFESISNSRSVFRISSRTV